MEAILERDKRIANAHSITTAHLVNAVYSLTGGNDIDLNQVMPYPSNQQSKSKGISEKTARILNQLIQSKKLPTHVISLIPGDIIQSIKTLQE